MARRPHAASGSVGPVTVTLTVRGAPWRAHVARLASGVEGLIPVIKGNGYGLGRHTLAHLAAEFCDTVAVGTIHELDGLPNELQPVVLTPTLAPPAVRSGSPEPILTVGNSAHIDALSAWQGRVLVKLESSMHRYGGGYDLVERASAGGLDVVGVSIHPPLAGTPGEHADEIRRMLADIDPQLTVSVSHLDATTYAALPTTHDYRLRLGTTLWHGDKSFFRLRADVLDVRPIRAGERAGYRQGAVESDGHLVMVGAGTANGIAALADGRSPFHFERTRLDLHEPPHMHTSMIFAAADDPVPEIGALVDVQRPLTATAVDAVEWA